MNMDSRSDANDPADVPAPNGELPSDHAAEDQPTSKIDEHQPDDGKNASPQGRALVGTFSNRRRRNIERFRDRPPFSFNPEIIKLFYAIDALKADSSSFVLQFLAPTPGEGTTTISWGFALAASYEYAEPTLIVDCNCHGKLPRQKMSLIDAFLETGYPERAVEKVPRFNRLFRARLSAEHNSMLEIDGAELRKLFDYLKISFSAIILDCPAANQSSDSLALSRYADGSVIVIKSTHSRRGVVEWTRDSLGQYGGLLLGAVFNQRKKYIPEWLYRYI